MFVYFEANDISLENKLSNLKRKLCSSSPALLYRAEVSRGSRADSFVNLEGCSGRSLLRRHNNCRLRQTLLGVFGIALGFFTLVVFDCFFLDYR